MRILSKAFYEKGIIMGDQFLERMKKYKRHSLVLFFILLLVGGGYMLQRVMQMNPVLIGVLHADRIKSQARPYIEFEKKFEQSRESLHDFFSKKEQDLRDAYIIYKKNPKKFKKQIDELKARAKDLEIDLQNRKEILHQQTREHVKKLEDLLESILEKVAQKNGLSIVLNTKIDEKNVVMFAQRTLDVTDLIIHELNQNQLVFEFTVSQTE